MPDRSRPQRAPGGTARRPASAAADATRPPTLDPSVIAELRESARPGAARRAAEALQQTVDALAADDPRSAVEAARAAKGVAPRSASVREALGIALYRLGRYREAASELLTYRRMTGRVDQNHLIADAYRGLGAPERGIPLVEEELLADLPPEARAEAAVVGGAALADVGRYSEALAILRSFPTNPDIGSPHALRIWYVTADVLLRAGRTEEAAELLRLVRRHDPQAFDVDERLTALESGDGSQAGAGAHAAGDGGSG